MLSRRAFAVGIASFAALLGVGFAGPLQRRLQAAGGHLVIEDEKIRLHETLRIAEGETVTFRRCDIDVTDRGGMLVIDNYGTFNAEQCRIIVDTDDLPEWRALERKPA